MKSWTVPLVLAALVLPLAVQAQSGGSGSAPQPINQPQGGGTQPQIEVQPLGAGFVLQGSQVQQQDETAVQQQQQGETATQEQGETATQEQGETATQQQGETATQQQGETAAQQQQGETGAQEGEAEQPAEAAPTTAQTGPPREAEGVSLEGLDKITARTFAFEAPLNETVRFGYLEVTARRCVVAAEEEAPERSAFLEVVEAKPGRNASKVFSGWMFASSPSVSAMEHAVYDIWVVDCMGYQGETTQESTPAAEVVPEDVEAPVEGVERPLD